MPAASAFVTSAGVGCSVSAGSARVGLAGSSAGASLLGFSSGASLPSVHELPQTLPNGAVDNRC